MTYIPIRIGTLRSDDPVNFDLYIKLGEKFLHYVRESDPLEGERIQKLKEKGVRKLYIDENAEQAYLTYLDLGVSQLQNTAAAVEVRAVVARDSMITEAENAARNLETEQGFQNTEKHVGQIAGFLMSEKGALKGILSAVGSGQLDNHQHSANVTSLSLSLANYLEIKNTKDLLELGLAALLHDIGKTKFSFDPALPFEKLNKEQKVEYYQHPKTGVDLLAGKRFITSRVLALIANHEEVGAGAGFPERKNLKSLPLLSQILNLCNAYDRFASVQGLLHASATQTFLQAQMGHFPLEHIQAISALLLQRS